MHGHRHTRRESGWDGGWGGGWGGQGNGPGFGPGRGPWGGPGGPGGRGRPGPPPWVAELVRHFGGPGFGPEFGGRRGPRARRGDVRAAILEVLAGDEMNGYQLIQQISERTNGAWKPSPGSVYPALQQLEDEGLVQTVESEGKRAYELTAEGRDYVAANRDELGNPFEAATGGMDEGVFDLRGLMFQVGAAAMQVAAAGHTDEARKILADTRRALYKILAEDDPGDDAA